MLHKSKYALLIRLERLTPCPCRGQLLGLDAFDVWTPSFAFKLRRAPVSVLHCEGHVTKKAKVLDDQRNLRNVVERDHRALVAPSNSLFRGRSVLRPFLV